MAVAFGAGEVELYDAVDRSSYTTASYTPTANAVQLVHFNWEESAIGATPVISDSIGSTFSAVLNQTNWDSIASPTKAKAWAWSLTGASPAARTLTIGFGATTVIGIEIQASTFTIMDTTTPVLAVFTNRGDAVASLSLALTGTTAGNALVVFVGVNTNSALTPASGWTEVDDNGHATPPCRAQMEYLLLGSSGDVTALCDPVGTPAICMIGLEIQVPVAAAPLTPYQPWQLLAPVLAQ